jgi:Fic family protein
MRTKLFGVPREASEYRNHRCSRIREIRRRVNTIEAASSRPRHQEWLEVIADPVRLYILRTLSSVSDATVAELIALGSASNPTLRRHLEDLVAVGVIQESPGESDGSVFWLAQ